MKFSCSVDVSGVRAMAEAAARSLREEQPEAMRQIIADAVQEDRDGHAYQNRTGDAEASTYASELKRSGDTFTVEAGMHVEYASQLDKRGFTEIVPLLDQAKEDVQTTFELAQISIAKG